MARVLTGQPAPPALRQALSTNLRFTESELTSLEADRCVVKVVETGDFRDVSIVGAVRIAVPPEAILRRLRQTAQFESGPGITAGARFSTPPRMSDLAALNLVRSEVDQIRNCSPGNCPIQIGERALGLLSSSVNWQSPDYVAEANRAVRSLWFEFLVAYQAEGNAALPVYHSGREPDRAQELLAEQLKKSPLLYQYVPDVAEYLLSFPKSRLQDNEDFFYWQMADLGFTPVFRIVHGVVQSRRMPAGVGYVTALKLIYASRYFQSGLEFRFLIPAAGQGGAVSTYVLLAQRALLSNSGVDGARLREVVAVKASNSLERFLMNSKTALEEAQATGR